MSDSWKGGSPEWRRGRGEVIRARGALVEVPFRHSRLELEGAQASSSAGEKKRG